LRVPSGPSEARRIEHRVAGGDVNPYLLFAAILGAALLGIEDAATPPPPTQGNAYGAAGPRVAPDLATAIALLDDPIMARIFDPLLIDNLIRTKRQDLAKCAQFSDSELVLALLETV
ncbi:MAG: glutamine synthetase, partial [Pseudomonadota bacterium]